MKHIDIWRLMGIIWGMAIVSDIAWSLTYPLLAVSMPAFIVKDILLTALITFVFLRYYFEHAPEKPSFVSGAKIGLLIFAITLAVSFVGSFAAAAVGLAPLLPPMGATPEWYIPFQLVLAAIMVLSSAATGWYLSKR